MILEDWCASYAAQKSIQMFSFVANYTSCGAFSFAYFTWCHLVFGFASSYSWFIHFHPTACLLPPAVIALHSSPQMNSVMWQQTDSHNQNSISLSAKILFHDNTTGMTCTAFLPGPFLKNTFIKGKCKNLIESTDCSAHHVINTLSHVILNKLMRTLHKPDYSNTYGPENQLWPENFVRHSYRRWPHLWSLNIYCSIEIY